MSKKTMSDEERRAILATLAVSLAKHHTFYHLAGPVTLPVKLRDKAGTYRSHSFIGGEGVQITGCYYGKRNELILVFRTQVPQTFSHLEILASKLPDILPDFSGIFDEMVKGASEGVIMNANDLQKAAQQRQEQEKVEALEKRREKNQLYGTW